MKSRPQFSLRTLLFVMVLVCLAAATAYQPRDERSVVIACQSMLRCTLLVMFPTICLVGAIQARTHAQAFYIGTLLPMILPTMMAWHWVTWSLFDFENLADVLDAFRSASEFEARRTASLWALSPLAGLVCVLGDWFLEPGSDWRVRSFIRMAMSLFIVACAIVGLMAGIIVLPAAGEPIESVAIRPLMVPSCIPSAVLVVSAVRCRGCARSLFAGAVVPTIFVPLALCQAVIWDVEPPHQWLFYVRHSIIAAWILAPCVGLAAVGCHWLFQLSGALSSARK